MIIHLNIWRQDGPGKPGGFKSYSVEDVSEEMSFLEMIDLLNEQLTKRGEIPVEFDHDCREGICGACSLMINGQAHGPKMRTATCQLHMRSFKDGDTIDIEPWRATAFPVIRDLVVDRSAFDRIMEAGGYVSISTGNAPDANAIPVSKSHSDVAMDFASCIGCGACVAACPNASASLFVGAKLTHLERLPQGKPEQHRRTIKMMQQMQDEGFGDCSNHAECEAVCPKGISISGIAAMRRAYMKALLSAEE